VSKPLDKRFPYMPGIDALRALAVLAVFGYHAGLGWVPGGFLGVDVFFVISGYLITSLLLREFQRGGHVKLGRFWLRRARRLLPAVAVLIAVSMVLAAIFEPARIDALRGDAISGLFYFANWHFVFTHESYFEQFGRPSLFTHLWSLSVEEQFYLFWPLVFAAGIKLFGRGRLVLGVLAGALASVALAWILFDPGGDASRVYYGTDTHAVGLLGGVALALVWSPIELRRHHAGASVGPILDAVGVLALGYVILCFLHVHDFDLALWHGGYLWLAIATTLVVAVVAHPAARLGPVLGQAPLLWLGLRSYSFYLWHWPVLVLTRPGIDVSLPRGILIPLQLLATLALADLSYRYVELPFRGKARLPGLPDGWLRLARPALIGAALAIVLFVGWSGLFAGRDHALERAEAAPTVARVTAKPARQAGPRRQAAGRQAARSTREAPETAQPATGEGGQPPPRRHRPSARRSHPPPLSAGAPAPRIIALGDSVMVGAAERLSARLGPGLVLNAKEGRQASEFVEIVERLRREGHRPDAMIIQMGNNGPLFSGEMEAIQRATAGVGELFLVTDHAPVSWVEESNGALEEAAEDWPHTTLVDWAAVAAAHEDELWDGIHLKPSAAGLYARLVSRAVREEVAYPAAPRRASRAGGAASRAGGAASRAGGAAARASRAAARAGARRTATASAARSAG
jgi:peptidoglycan/LPS O-acetylase OafA/YrhL